MDAAGLGTFFADGFFAVLVVASCAFFFADLDRSAITVRLIHKLGRAAVDSNEITIENLEVPDEDVVGRWVKASTTCSIR